MIKACRSPRTPRTSPDERQRSRPYRTLRYYPPRIQETALGHDSVVQERSATARAAPSSPVLSPLSGLRQHYAVLSEALANSRLRCDSRATRARCVGEFLRRFVRRYCPNGTGGYSAGVDDRAHRS